MGVEHAWGLLKPRAQFFLLLVASDLPVRTIRFCFVVFGVTSSICCHTHDSRTTVTVYSARPRLVGLALYTATDDGSRVAYGGPIPAYPQ